MAKFFLIDFKNLKIMKAWLIVPFEPIPEIDGKVRFLRYGYLANALVEANHQVTWWMSDFDHFRKQNRYGSSKQVQLKQHLNLQLLYAPPYYKNISLERIKHNLVLAQSFEKIVYDQPEKPDVIFVCIPTLELAEKAIQYGKKNNIPVIVDVVDLWPDLYLNPFPQWLKPIISKLLYREFKRCSDILQSSQSITAISKNYLRWGLNRAKRSSTQFDQVFPLGYSVPDISDLNIKDCQEKLISFYGLETRKFIVTFLGQFGSSYDVETIAYSARKLSSNSDIQFVFAGDGDKMPLLKEITKNLTNTVFTGWLDQLESVALLRSSSLGLCAYSTKALQSLPNKPFEYMAAGLPLLSSLKGELESMISNHNIGKSYQAGDVASLVRELCWFNDNRDICQQMSKNSALLFTQKFNVDIIYPALVKYMEAIVDYRQLPIT
jgi:glycosyltransferase involved in cell wall biosynthesis